MSKAAELADEILEAQRRRTKLDEYIKELQHELCGAMAADQVKTFDVDHGDRVVKATYVSSTRTQVDEVSLKKALGAREFNKITTRKVDNKLIEKAIISGNIDARIVSQNTTIVKTTPYVRITETRFDEN
jgi:hypothetical protein